MTYTIETVLPPRHIVAVSGLIRDKSGRVLLIHSPRREWEFPGGQVEEGESLTEALEREVMEETGVTVSVGALVGIYSNIKSHIVMFGFICEWIGGEPQTGPEAIEIEWVEQDAALERVTHPAIRDRLRDMLLFEGQVIYRSYSFDTRTPGLNYIIHENRSV